MTPRKPFARKKLLDPSFWLWQLRDRLSEPLHLNMISAAVALIGSVRARIDFDLYERRPYAFGVLYAADAAKELGIDRIAVIEFGVASGEGLLSLARIAADVSKITGVQIDVVGFDTGKGMPPPKDYRDHPEFYMAGDYPMDQEGLRRRLPPHSQLILGDIAETVADFLTTARGVIGFVSVDVDYYSSTVSCLSLLTHSPSSYLPVTPIYFDDVVEDNFNPWCGELLAINEFNARETARKITPFNNLRSKRIFKNSVWIDQMYTLQVLDHPTRSAGQAIARSPHVI